MADKLIVMPVPVTEEESKKIGEYCKFHGLKKAAWLKRLALREIAKSNGQGDGSQQARDMAETIGAHG